MPFGDKFLATNLPAGTLRTQKEHKNHLIDVHRQSPARDATLVVPNQTQFNPGRDGILQAVNTITSPPDSSGKLIAGLFAFCASLIP